MTYATIKYMKLKQTRIITTVRTKSGFLPTFLHKVKLNYKITTDKLTWRRKPVFWHQVFEDVTYEREKPCFSFRLWTCI